MMNHWTCPQEYLNLYISKGMRMVRFAVIIILVSLFACSEENEAERASAGQMWVRVNGEKNISSSVTAIVRPATPAANPRTFIEASFDAPSGFFKILISASTQDIFKLIDVGEYVVEGEDVPLNHGIIYYAPGGLVENAFVSFHAGGDVVGKIVITQLDTVNKLISGTFECTAANPDSGESVEINSGSFTQIPYSE
jgi:hypothetical protein